MPGPIPTFASSRLRSLASAALCSIALAVAASGQTVTSTRLGDLGETEPSPAGRFRFVENVQAPWTNLGLFPVRPMAITADNLFLYAVNTHDSTVRFFDFEAGDPAISTWRVAWGPVSLAIFDGHDDGVERLLVVSRGTHALLVLDRFSGERLELVELPFEPGDILVDEAGKRAFVSCSGADLVVEVDLISLAKTEYPLQAKHPLHLSFDAVGNVLVAPMFSGNNSTVVGGFPNGKVIIDLDDEGLSAEGLPDEDLFRIDPDAGTVEAVSRHAATTLFGHGVNPSTGNHWQLGVEAKNKDPQRQNEPALKGDFSENRLTITTLPGRAAPPAETHTLIDLDDSDPNTEGVQFDPTRTVGIPTGLAFSTTGFALVTGLATDNITILGPSGAQGEGTFLAEWDLPDGSIPRQAIFDPATETVVLVYLWGTNELQAFNLSGAPLLTLGLGHDPTPPLVKEGREIFYDASRSEHNNQTCGSCHFDGRTDMVVWNLSNAPLDNKGPLVTQTLASIDAMAPYHWRGERSDLLAFNAAFAGLLGGTELDETPGGDFDRFQAFVFSLQSPANPGTDARMVLNDDLVPSFPNGVAGSAVDGQEKFINFPSDSPHTCHSCHTLPTGSDNDLTLEIPSRIAQQTHIEVTGFNETWRKEQPIVPLQILGNTIQKPLLGSGLLHDGSVNNMFDFVSIFQALGEEGISDVTAFMMQLPSGVAPVSHRALLLDEDHQSQETIRTIRTLLLKQARKRLSDLAVVGTFPGVAGEIAWAYDPASGTFLSEDSSIAPARFEDFVQAAADGSGANLFVGLPLGNARGFAIDHDLDELRNRDEALHAADPLDADTDADTFLDGHEVANGSDPADDQSTPNDLELPKIRGLEVEWVTTKNARITLRTNEPTTLRIDYSTPQGAAQFTTDDALKRVHNVILTDLLPSTFGAGVPPEFEVFHDYTGTVTVTDNAGRQTSVSLPPFTTDKFDLSIGLPPVAVIGDIQWTSSTPDISGGTLGVTGQFRMDLKAAGPPAIPVATAVAAGNILVNGVVSSSFTATGSSTRAESYKILGNTFSSMPGPFLITEPTIADGTATFAFEVTGLQPGDVVTFNPIAIMYVDVDAFDPLDPDFGTDPGNTIPAGNWSFADTPAAKRNISITF